MIKGSVKLENNLIRKDKIEKEENQINIQPKQKKSRNNNRKFLSRFLKDNSDKHYYYNNNNKKEWEFLKIQGSNNNYYFKCST